MKETMPSTTFAVTLPTMTPLYENTDAMKMDRYSNGRATAEQAASQMLSATMCVCAGVCVSMCMCVPECVCVFMLVRVCIQGSQPTNQAMLLHTHKTGGKQR